MAVAHKFGVPVIGTNHFLPENLLPYLDKLPLPRKVKIDVLWRLMLWTYNRLRVVTTPTETAANIIRQQNIHVPVISVSCGVDTQHFYPNPNLDRAATRLMFGLDPDKKLFLYVGRQDREKRIDLLLRALAILKQEGRNDLQLAIAGQGAAQTELIELAHSLHLDGQVHFLGYVSNEKLPLLYQAADMFTMPSPEELQSIATLEAMASGLPTLAANARALPELVTSGINGYLFQPGIAASIAQGMALLASGLSDWPKMAVASRSRAAVHSLRNTIQRYESLYRRYEKSASRTAGHTPARRFSPVKMD